MTTNAQTNPSTAGGPAAPLRGRLALVTGASRGIGRACAEALAAAGARVILIARGAAALDEAAAALPGAIPIACDVADVSAIERTITQVREELGEPDILVNNAGRFLIAPVAEVSLADFAGMIGTNLLAPFAITRAVLPAMLARRSGHIVTIGSVADRNIFPGNGAYSASKYGIRALHEVMHAELRGSGVRTTLVSPSAVDTALWDPIDPDSKPGFAPRAAMLRPEAVAAAMLYAVTAPAEVNVDELRLSRR